jgi:hypothetical protein
MTYFDPTTLETLAKTLSAATANLKVLRKRYLVHEFKKELAAEFAREGLVRRIDTLLRCVEVVFRLLPPALEKAPANSDAMDATIYIQSFVYNIFGCLDNLAWVWVTEKDVRGADGASLDRMKVGIGEKDRTVRQTFSKKFLKFLESRDDWVREMVELRTSLARRVPLYMSPIHIPAERLAEYTRLVGASADALQRNDRGSAEAFSATANALGSWQPVMTHSFLKDAQIVAFHPILLQACLIIDEMGREMLAELNR